MTEIRQIEARDAARWRELYLAYGVFYETAFTPDILDGVWGWLMDPAHPVTALVASADDAVIGFAMFREHPDTLTAGPALYLDDLFVDPAARGLGAATALLERLRLEARDRACTTVRWITADDNVTAQRLYDRIAARAQWVTYEMSVE